MTHDPLCPYRPAQSGACDHPFDPNISCAVFHVSQPEIPCQCDLLAKADARGYSRAYTELLKVEIGTGNAQGGAGHGLGGGPLRPTLGGKS